MMKKISFLMLFALSFLVLNCRTEDFHNEEEAHGNTQFHLTSQRISLNESKHKAKLLPELKNAKLGIETFAKNNAQSKIVHYGNGVSIDTDDVVYIEYGPYHTYTFKINRDNAPADAPVENLILSLEPDGTYKELLKTYHLTQSDWHELSLGNGIDLTSKTTTVEVAKGTYNQSLAKMGGSGCYYESQQVYQACCHGVHGEGNIGDWGKCTCTGSGLPKMYTIEIVVCPPEPGAPTTGWVPLPSSPTAPTGGGGASLEGGSNSGSQTNPTNPTDPNTVEGAQGQLGGTPTLPNLSVEHFKFNQIISQLSPALQSWINQPYNAEVYTYFINYFTYNNQTLEAGNFVKWSLNFLHQNQNVTWDEFQNWFVIDPILNNTLQNELFEDWADPNRVKPTTRFKNNVKINGIYNQIKNASNFKQYLQNFEPTFSVAHLMFDIANTENPNALAQTSEPQNYWIKITFNKDWDFTNTPKILIAGAFMHEIIHAEMYRKLLSLSSSNGNIDASLLGTMLNQHNYPGLFDYYIKNVKGNESAQHQMMGAHYMNIIVNFFKQVYGNQYTDTEYLSIAWQGLKGTTAWNLLTQAERDLYDNTYQNNYNSWEK